VTPDWGEVGGDVIEPLGASARLPRRAVERTKRIIAHQRRFTQPSTKGFRPLLFLRGDDFAEALHLFRLRAAAWGQGWDLYEAWQERHRKALEVTEEELDQIRGDGRRQRNRRRRKRRRRRPDGEESA